ncbi:hypothetical protein IVB34_18040 [Bradyrhizobium sp. 2]|nr:MULTISPECIES: hypothetical protein [unclassified Bradyrhizobium]MCK1441516.1 hypothetical protein [Bradyrhizobium sp. 48]MCK1460234.1 hypothetical protein [Bradyrhizobium sp. 2]
MSKAYLVQVLLPKERGDGEPVSQSWFEEFLEEMTGKFGGATSFVRVPGQDLSLPERLERELSQEEIVIRAQEIIPL